MPGADAADDCASDGRDMDFLAGIKKAGSRYVDAVDLQRNQTLSWSKGYRNRGRLCLLSGCAGMRGHDPGHTHTSAQRKRKREHAISELQERVCQKRVVLSVSECRVSAAVGCTSKDATCLRSSRARRYAANRNKSQEPTLSRRVCCAGIACACI